MTERERLIELLDSGTLEVSDNYGMPNSTELADYLIDHGVIVSHEKPDKTDPFGNCNPARIPTNQEVTKGAKALKAHDNYPNDDTILSLCQAIEILTSGVYIELGEKSADEIAHILYGIKKTLKERESNA